jgi:ribosomal-protein-alanine N-acetyltransferase
MIETRRLILRSWCENDLAPFAAINSSERVCEFLPSTLTRGQSDAFAQRIVDHFANHGFGFYAVELRQTGEFIGFTGLSIPRFDAPFMPAVEIGWRLGEEHWGKGYGSEAARAALDHALGRLQLGPVVSFTVPQNLRSRRVMENIGLTHDPSGDFDHPNLPEGHRLRRHVLYRCEPETCSKAALDRSRSLVETDRADEEQQPARRERG